MKYTPAVQPNHVPSVTLACLLAVSMCVRCAQDGIRNAQSLQRPAAFPGNQTVLIVNNVTLFTSEPEPRVLDRAALMVDYAGSTPPDMCVLDGKHEAGLYAVWQGLAGCELPMPSLDGGALMRPRHADFEPTCALCLHCRTMASQGLYFGGYDLWIRNSYFINGG